MSRTRIGVFGGTFDPPHIGHLILACEACEALSFETLLWILTPVPPHKLNQTITSLEHRLEMLRLAIANEESFEVSRVEIDRPGPHYTVETMQLLTEQYPSANLILLIGGDSLRDLPTWHQPAELVTACHEIGVIRRPDDAVDLSAWEQQVPGMGTKVRFVDAPLLDISSRAIRRRAREKLKFRYYLTPPVYEYIIKHNLYTQNDLTA